ncbi:MAG: hypothetical protein HC908_01050 [Calothrix sp. SM1_7_51]|nr:hypothetical protein [Calothrix sp. SM1_7_51]
MSFQISRRQFGQLAFASSAAAAFGILIQKTVAQTKVTTIIGARSVVTVTNTSDNPNSETPDEGDEADNIASENAKLLLS